MSRLRRITGRTRKDRTRNEIIPNKLHQNRDGSSPKILGTIAPISPFITESISSVLRNRKKYELHIGLHLKAIISKVANSVMG